MKNIMVPTDFEEFKEGGHTWLKMIWKNPCLKTDRKDVGEGLIGINEITRGL